MRKMNVKWKCVLISTLVAVALCGCGTDTSDYITQTEIDSNATQHETSVENTLICVFVCGEVKKPGVYQLPAESRVCDLFILAGGFTENAATDYWNQARLLKDGEMFYVPTKEEAKDRSFLESNGGNGSISDQSKVNINTASKEELMSIPGIGEAKALAILSYRKENGSFSSLEELKQVEGIKDGVYSKMKDYIEI